MSAYADQLLLDLERRVARLETLESRGGLVYADYTTATAQALPDGVATTINFDTLVTDSHSAVTTGAAWRFTAPRAGLYLVTAYLMLDASNAWDAGEALALIVRKGGPTYSVPANIGGLYRGNASICVGASLTDHIWLALGDWLDVQVLQNSGAVQVLYAAATFNRICITSLS